MESTLTQKLKEPHSDLDLIEIVEQCVRQTSASVQIANPAYLLTIADMNRYFVRDPATGETSVRPDLTDEQKVAWGDVSFRLHRMVARTALIAGAAQYPFPAMHVTAMGIRCFDVDTCETCGAEIQAANVMSVAPTKEMQLTYGAEAMRALAVQLSGEGRRLLQTMVAEGWYDDDSGKERCPHCPTKVVWVNAYHVTRSYGGPEEGGWWYNEGQLLAAREVRDATDEKIEAVSAELKETFKEYDSSIPLSSMRSNGQLQIQVSDEAGADYPSERPYYS